MPYLEYPKSDLKRNDFLNQCSNTTEKDKELGVIYLPELVVSELLRLKPEFNLLFEKLKTSLSDKEKEVREKNQSVDILHVYVRDFWVVAKRRAIRLDQPAEVFTKLGLPLSGDIPNLNNEKEILAAATHIVKGDASLVANSYPAMENPSAAEVEGKLLVAQKERDDIAPADRSYNIFQKEVSSMRIPVDILIKDIADHLQFALRKETESNQRRIMRTYGFEYRYLKGEPEAEVESEVVENE